MTFEIDEHCHLTIRTSDTALHFFMTRQELFELSKVVVDYLVENPKEPHE